MKLCTSCNHGLVGAPSPCPLCQADLGAVPETTGDELVGMRVAEHYRLIELLGEGAMGWVYRAVHATLDRSVAIKLLKTTGDTHPEAVARFEHEARTTSRLHHPHIVAPIDFGRTPGGFSYLVTEFLAGGTLGDLLALHGAPPVSRAMVIFHQIMAAVEEAHWSHVIHRDLKPDNIAVTTLRSGDDFVKVLDFGIATVANEDGDEQGVVGTPGFMAPETIQDGVADERSDIYSLGVILFELLTGKPPFEADDWPMALLSMHLNDAPPLLRAAAPDRGLPVEMERVVARTLAKDPNERPASIAELRSEVMHAVNCMGRLDLGCEQCARPVDPETGQCTLHGRLETGPPSARSGQLATSATVMSAERPDSRALRELLQAGPFKLVSHEIRELVDFLVGEDKLLEIVGPAASNSLRLVEAADAAARSLGLHVVRFTPDPQCALRPWYPIRRVIGDMLGCGVAPTSPDVVVGPARDLVEPRHLTGLTLLFGIATDAAPTDGRERVGAIVRAVNALLGSSRGERRGVCIVVRDINDFDRASQVLVRSLEATARSPQIKICTTSESGYWSPRAGRKSLRAANFDDTTVEAMLAETELSPRVDKRELSRDILNATQGQPFFVEQAIVAHLAGGDVNLSPQALTAWRLARLPEDALDVLRLVCALGEEVELQTLTGMVNEDLLPLAIDMLLRARMLSQSSGRLLAPASPALRRLVLEAMSVDERLAIHRRIYSALEDLEAATFVLARHAFEGDLDEVALSLLEEAGDRARDWADYETAALVHYRRASHVARWRLLLSESDPHYLELSLKLGEALLEARHTRAAEVVFKEVIGVSEVPGPVRQRAQTGLERMSRQA